MYCTSVSILLALIHLALFVKVFFVINAYYLGILFFYYTTLQNNFSFYNDIVSDAIGYRTLIRLSIMLGILFIGESIPRFYTILALVGGTTIALLTFVLPSYCYLSLVNQTPPEGQAPTYVICLNIGTYISR